MQGKATYAGAWGQNIKLMSDNTAIMHGCISLVFTVLRNRVVQAMSCFNRLIKLNLIFIYEALPKLPKCCTEREQNNYIKHCIKEN